MHQTDDTTWEKLLSHCNAEEIKLNRCQLGMSKRNLFGFRTRMNCSII